MKPFRSELQVGDDGYINNDYNAFALGRVKRTRYPYAPEDKTTKHIIHLLEAKTHARTHTKTRGEKREAVSDLTWDEDRTSRTADNPEKGTLEKAEEEAEGGRKAHSWERMCW